MPQPGLDYLIGLGTACSYSDFSLCRLGASSPQYLLFSGEWPKTLLKAP